MLPIAILYQALSPISFDGAYKPIKPGGYADSGADIAYTLKSNGWDVITPVQDPNPNSNNDWVFPDSAKGIKSALNAGAKSLWANTILYNQHPLKEFAEIPTVGCRLDIAEKFDDKWFTNRFLSEKGLPTAKSYLLKCPNLKNIGKTDLDSFSANIEYENLPPPHLLEFPLIIKPVRGRGSQGVSMIDSHDALHSTLFDMIHATNKTDRETLVSSYGSKFIVEEYLDGREITVSVFPPGEYTIKGELKSFPKHWCLPVVERSQHIRGILPYSGNVAVDSNSSVDLEFNDPKIVAACAKAGSLINSKHPIRIDCRLDLATGEYKMFDINIKPNITGPGRPNRSNQSSLLLLAAQGIGWSYYDMLDQIARNAFRFNQNGKKAQSSTDPADPANSAKS